jgi:gluconolactonase
VSITTLAAGIGFTEGPLWSAAEGLLVTSMSRGLIYRVALDGAEPEVAAETGGGPNGLAPGPGDTVCVAQNGAATIQSRSPRPVNAGIQLIGVGGAVEDVLTEGCGTPNDLAFGPDGLLWFTDPGAARPRVCTLDLDSGRLEVAIEGIPFPNGIAFGIDADVLFVVDSESGEILRYRLEGGAPRGPEVFASAPGGPDGIALDADGNLYAALFHADEVAVFDPRGQRVETLSTGAGSRPTNCCFAGADLTTLVVTAASGGRVLALSGRFRGRSAAPWLDG